MSEERQIDYETLLHEALRDAKRGLMHTVLTGVAAEGLPGDHHFYISFNTLAPGVSIAPRLLQSYPTEMTIVLQHRFWDLFVQADRFEVKLTFKSIRERLVVPFTAVRSFSDPSVPFSLNFDDTPMRGLVAVPNGADVGGRQASDRSQTERKKTVRKPKPDAPQLSANSGSAPVEDKSVSPALASPPSASVAAAPIAAGAKSGPRLVDTANDSAKVVSLDQFRKK